ncbi:MAG: HAMP domain-containing sensor histidine kinase [Hyphomicrobiaceae bacterium]
MNLNRIARTATFRLSALYALVFALSVLLLAILVYGLTQAALLRQINRSIQVEAASLASEFESGGPDRLVAELTAREKGAAWEGFRYGLLDARGTHLAGALGERGMQRPGWANSFVRTPGARRDIGITTLTLELPGRYALIVGRITTSVYDVERLLIEMFGWALGATLLFGIAGGLFVSARFLDRVEGIRSAAQSIVNGHYRERMPISGTGDDIDRLSETLNVMLDRIGSLMESLRQVSNDIAHDLRTPLSRLRQRLEAATAMDLDQTELREVIKTTMAETDDILATFSALLRIAQIEAGTRRAGFAEFDFSALVTDVTEAYEPSLHDEGKSLKCDAPGSIRLIGDRELLTQLVANLIENAAHHTPAGTNVSVQLNSTENAIRLVVADNGPGIPPELRERLFQRFYRLERSRTTPGSGLGLSLVKAVADLHGAKISIADNSPGFRMEIVFAPPAR